MPGPVDVADHVFIAFGWVGAFWAAWKARKAAHLAQKNTRDIKSQLVSRNGGSISVTVDDCLDMVKRLEGKLDDLSTIVDDFIEDSNIEHTSWATIFAAHISDGHDPSERITRRRNRRLDDPKEY